jgi:PadR family transcriptional regulator AphA
MAARVPELSLADWAVLGVVAEGPTHGWAVTRELAPDGALGRVWTVPRPVVYRSLATLVAKRLAVECGEVAGGRGPRRTLVRVTPAGRRALHRWLEEPVAHVRDVRSTFLLKLALLDRSDHARDELVERQLATLAPVFEALRRPVRGPGFDAVLGRWRRESALAVQRFLESLRRAAR